MVSDVHQSADAGEWPLCPGCGEPRAAQCPVCGSAGSDFAWAEFQNPAPGAAVLLYCDDCDDVMQPEWYRRCAACGHDFGGGLVIEPTVVASRGWQQVIVAGLATAALFLTAYFAWLFTAQTK